MFRSTLESALTGAAFLFLVLPATAVAQVVPIASGAIVLDQPGGKRSFSFTAVKLPGGAIAGQAELNVRSVGVRFHFDITSTFVDAAGNVFLAGPITKSIGTGGPALGVVAFFALRRKNGIVQTTTVGAAPPAFATAKSIFMAIGSPPESAFLKPAKGVIKLR